MIQHIIFKVKPRYTSFLYSYKSSKFSFIERLETATKKAIT